MKVCKSFGKAKYFRRKTLYNLELFENNPTIYIMILTLTFTFNLACGEKNQDTSCAQTKQSVNCSNITVNASVKT